MTAPTVLAIDPAMGLTGYAVLERTTGPGRILDAGLIRVPEGKAFIPRIHSLNNDIAGIVLRHGKTLRTIVVETPLTITPGMGASRSVTTLPTYGIAVGSVLACCMVYAEASDRQITLIETSASAWSKGQDSVKDDKYKLARVARVKLLFGSQYELGPKSTAGNVADAILMASWYLLNHAAPPPPRDPKP